LRDRGFFIEMAQVTNFSKANSVGGRRTGSVRQSVRLLFILSAALGMTGCASPVSLYHDAEGGDIAHLKTPIPGSNLPYPNLASVPVAPAALTATEKQAVQQQMQAARTAPAEPAGAPLVAAPGALGGLALPASAPPEPDVPGINWQGLPEAPAPTETAAAPMPVMVKPDGPPILLAFPPKSAVLNSQAQTALSALAKARGSADIRVGGFGGQDKAVNPVPDEAALTLALHRARRIADALTAAGVPPAKITLVASAAGYGGFAQLVY
jgi:hypothetical protein